MDSLKTGKYLKQRDFCQATNYISVMKYLNSLAKPLSRQDAQAIVAEKHKISERKRRVKISNQYATLCTFLPNLTKKNKASVLAEAIRCVRELEKRVSELQATISSSRSPETECVFPGGEDVLRIRNCDDKRQGNEQVKVMFCCEDKRKLMCSIARTVSSVGGKVVRAEMVSIGGRTKCSLRVQGIKGNQELRMLKSALISVTEKPHEPKMNESSYVAL